MTASVARTRKVSHADADVVFDDRNILGYAGVLPLRRLADSAGLGDPG